MNKKLILLFILLVISFSIARTCQAFDKSITLIVNGKQISFSESTGIPYITETGKAMMPLRVCLNSIGCIIDWNPEK